MKLEAIEKLVVLEMISYDLATRIEWGESTDESEALYDKVRNKIENLQQEIYGNVHYNEISSKKEKFLFSLAEKIIQE